MTDIAIRAQSISKCYETYDTPRDRLKQFILPKLKKITGKPAKQYFNEFWALRNVSFEIKKGETVGIIGRNGSGKSTLLQIICGTLNPTSGNIQTNGRVAALLELGTGFNPEFTGRENVYMNATVLGLRKEEIDAVFDEISAFADIGNFIEQPVKNYSSGMLVRLAFSVQVAIDPDIFIVDEALAVGDEKFQRKCFARLEKLKSKGCSILFVSHAASSIIELCDRTLLLDQGVRLMYSTAPQAVRAYQKLIYAPDAEYKSLVQKYRAADQSGEVIETDNDMKLSPVPNERPSDVFDHGLVPETTVVYPVQGAEIKSITILEADGRIVNVLQPGKSYQFEVAGLFSEDFAGIFCGIHIRTISGLVITGQRYPEEGRYLEQIRSGNAFKINFAFRMDLLPGVYFVGGGIWSAQEPNCVHRILDALMFRVLPLDHPISFGYVDLSTNEPSLELI